MVGDTFSVAVLEWGFDEAVQWLRWGGRPVKGVLDFATGEKQHRRRRGASKGGSSHQYGSERGYHIVARFGHGVPGGNCHPSTVAIPPGLVPHRLCNA